jgi:hypothetical protein
LPEKARGCCANVATPALLDGFECMTPSDLPPPTSPPEYPDPDAPVPIEEPPLPIPTPADPPPPVYAAG